MTLGRLSQCLKESGHYVHVIHTGEARDGQTSKSSVSLPGYKEVRVGLPSPIRLRQRWRRKRPDAVYIATESPLGISAIKAAREIGIPVVAGFHTNFHQYLNKYNLGGMEKPAMSYLKHVHSKADMTLAPSYDVMNMLIGEGFKNVQLLGRGVDTDLFCPSKRSPQLRLSWGAQPSDPVVMIVGRVAVEKNLEFGMQVISQMLVKEPRLQAVVVGAGPMLESLSKKYPDVHFVGLKKGEELAQHYASADILLFPSETETFGNVLLEGMASGLVTVSYDYAAAAIHVKDHVNGLVADIGDEQGFIEKALQTVGQRDLSQLCKVARETLLEQSWERVTAELEGHLMQMIAEQPASKRRLKKCRKLKLRSLFLSDIHLGTYDSKTREVIEVLKNVECDKIYLNGDIIDGWALKRGSKWKSSHTKVLRVLLRKMEKEGTELIYLRGNHDDFLEKILPLDIGGLKIEKECIHESLTGERYLVIHGDGFDSVSTNHRWIANVGAVGYDFLLKVNRVYNLFRAWRGKEYFSLSKAVKANVKSAVSFVDNYEEKLEGLAVSKNCKGIICGHIHTPADKIIGQTHYLNSGDWVETMSCIFEHRDGKFEVVHYEDFLKRIESEARFDTDLTEEMDADGSPFDIFTDKSEMSFELAQKVVRGLV